MDIQYEEIGKRIRKERKKQRLTQAQLADRIGIAHSHMSDIENGKTKMGVDILVDIADALQVSTDWVLRERTPGYISKLSDDMVRILSDCTPTEGKMYAQILKDTKRAFRNFVKVDE